MERAMQKIEDIYIGGEFVEPHGREEAALFNPSTEEQIGTVRLGDREDVSRAVAAAKRAFPDFSRTSKVERIAMLEKLSAAVAARRDDLIAVMAEEFGAPAYFTNFAAEYSSTLFIDMATTLKAYEFR